MKSNTIISLNSDWQFALDSSSIEFIANSETNLVP